MTEQATTSVAETLARLRKSWEAYALSGLGSGAADDEGGAAADLPQPGLSEVKDWRGLGALTHAQIPACLPIRERLAARAASRAWCRAAEHGPAKAAWLMALSDAGLLRIAAAAASEGTGLVASYARHRFLGGGTGSKVFKGKPMDHGEMKVGGRLRFKQPVASFSDGSAAALSDCAPPTLQPDVVLTVYDMSSLVVFGSVPISGAKHGKSIQRPLTMTSLQAARISSVGDRQACVVAMQKLAVVFSWQLGGSGDDESGSIGVRDGRAEEVRWLEKGKEVLRSAAFVGAGCAAPVAVLFEGGRDGPSVEIFCKAGAESATPYLLREVVSISKAKVPTSVPGVLHGGSVVLWANSGDRAIDFVRLQPPAALSGEDGGAGGTSTGVGAVFARARQAARKGKLRVGADGAGLDLEASRWGYIVEEVEDDPGQPDIVAGDCIFTIGGQSLHSLDEETMNWRFGRNFADGAEVTILPADHVKAILAADKGASEAKGPVVTQAAVHRGEQVKRQHFVFSSRIEAWCVASIRDPPRLVAVTDNRLVLADLSEDGAITQEALVGVARAPWKRPVERLAMLDEASDVLLAGVAKGVLLWRVPALVAPFGKASGDAELLAAISMPARCNLVGASMGLSCSTNPLGWVAADCSGAGANTDGGFDVWLFYSGRHRPLIQLSGASGGSSGKKPGLKGDAVSQAFSTVGAAVDAISAAMQAAVSAAGGPPGAGISAARSWLSKLRQDRVEPLYSAVEKAEPICGDAVRELRRWLRAEGRGAGFARQDGARSLIGWTEECRRLIVWPMQAAFQAEASDSDPEDLPTRESVAANARSTGAAAGTVPRGAAQ